VSTGVVGPKVLGWADAGHWAASALGFAWGNEGGKKIGPAVQDGLQVREENRKEKVKGRLGRARL
jgi:hypothetical protein